MQYQAYQPQIIEQHQSEGRYYDESSPDKQAPPGILKYNKAVRTISPYQRLNEDEGTYQAQSYPRVRPVESDQAPSSSNNQFGSGVYSTQQIDVNETGFTNKLAHGGQALSSIQYSGGPDERKRAAPIVGTGYYDQNGRYVATLPGQGPPPGYEPAEPETREKGNNNTSRFGQNQSNGHNLQQYSSSTFQEQSSLTTPNVSHGQVNPRDPRQNMPLDQLLMMKSGEFSANKDSHQKAQQYQTQVQEAYTHPSMLAKGI